MISKPRLAAGIAIAITLLATLMVLFTGGSGHYTVTAVFAQAHGLVEGGRVLAAGRPVGSIQSIELDKRDGLPHVVLRVDESYGLRRGATADLRLISNSGELNRVVYLTAGNGPALAAGARIPTTRTDEPVELDDVLGTLEPSARADLRSVFAKLNGATRGLDGAFSRSLRHSGRALQETASLLGEVNHDRGALRTLVAKSRSTADAFAAQRAALGTTVSELSLLLRTTGRRQRELGSSIRKLPRTLASVRSALDETHATVPSLTRLAIVGAPAARVLRAVAPDLSRTLATATPTLRDVAGLMRRAPRQLDAIAPLLRVARPVVKSLTPVLRDLLPQLDLLRVYTPEITGFLGNWTGIAASYDAAGHAIRTGMATGSPPNDDIGLDSDAPGYIPRPFLRVPGTLAGSPWRDYSSSFLAQEPLK